MAKKKDWSRHGADPPDGSENPRISFCERYWGFAR
jgi:hypothetical protein